MSSFSASHMDKKLKSLTMSQQSIQTLSLWCIHHRKHAKNVVQTWFRELQKVKPKRKLALMYLANDILQNSRRKGTEYSKEFGNILSTAFSHCTQLNDPKITEALKRILQIWIERRVYNQNFVDKLTKCLDPASLSENSSEESRHTPPLEASPIKEAEFVVTEHKLSNTPPDPDELVRKLQELENSATQDAVVREKIANLPTQVTDPTFIDKVEDLDSAHRLREMIDNACELLAEYNKRLEAEQLDRQDAQRMLLDYTTNQKRSLVITKERLQEYVGKLEKVTAVKKELQSHLENLPDLSKLPTRVPLPSAGDLFASSGKLLPNAPALPSAEELFSTTKDL